MGETREMDLPTTWRFAMACWSLTRLRRSKLASIRQHRKFRPASKEQGARGGARAQPWRFVTKQPGFGLREEVERSSTPGTFRAPATGFVARF